MITAISTALSGINAASVGIDVVGNNLANLNTIGYKDARVSFEDLISQSLGGIAGPQVGLGVQSLTATQFAQGAIQTATGPFDAAINGNGFFVLQGANQQTLLTRDGEFSTDANGTLVTATGQNVQGWQAAANGTINASGSVTNLTVPIGQLYPPSATTTFSMDANLDASSPSGTTFSQQIQAVDSLGNSLPLTVTFTRTATAGQWSYQVSVPASDVSGNKGPNPVNLLAAPGTITFDSSGNLTAPAAAASPVALTVPALADGATIGSAGSNVVNWSFYSGGAPTLTQFDQASAVSSNTQDGLTAAQLTGVALGAGGLIQATYSNGATQTVGELAVATVQNPQSLVSDANNTFAMSGTTSALTVGTSGTGGRGTVLGQSLESSTSDITTEFANLLVFERSYQANSRVITASDEVVQDTMALIK
jgi:flagellar hook protein FlgE